MSSDTKEPNFEELDKAARIIVEALRNEGHTAYYVGGCVRDMIMQRGVIDIDIATSAKPEEVQALFKKTIPVGIQFGVVIVLQNGIEFEVTTFRSDGAYLDGRHPVDVTFSSPEEDAARRDFTINGLYYDPVEEKVIDFVGGEEDIKKGVIRAIGDANARFKEDKLRMLRAVRFASRFAFEIDEPTKKAIIAEKGNLGEVSSERIRDEFVKMMTDRSPHHAIGLLDELDLLEEFLPEISAMKGVEQPSEFHPEGDVFVHTLLLLDQLKFPNLILSLGCLFHDVGKPATQTHEDRIRFNKHEHVGAQMTEKIMKRLRFSNKEIDAVCHLVKNHMMFAVVQEMRESKLKRMMSHEHFDTELEMHKIDCTASHGNLENYEFLLSKKEEYENTPIKPEPLLTGHDLLAKGFEAGPKFKAILDEAYDLQPEGKITSHDEALEWVNQKKNPPA